MTEIASRRRIRTTVVLALSLVDTTAHAWTVNATWETFAQGDPGGDQNLGQGDGLYSGNSRTSVVTTNTHLGSKALSVFLPAGVENTWQTEFRLPTDIVDGQSVWARFYLYVPADFDWTCNPITKLFRLAVVDAAGGGAGFASILATRPGSYGCAGAPNDFGYLVGGAELNSAPQFICQNVASELHFLTPGTWHALELHVKASATGSGVYRVWHNGVLTWEKTGLNTIPAGGAIFHGSGNVANHLLGWWNGGVPKDQTIYFDDLTYTNDTPANLDAAGNPMIGPTDWSVVRPSAPANLQAH